MPTELQFKHFSEIHASQACSVCSHVFAGDAINCFGNGGVAYAAACSERCLYSRERFTIRAEHLFHKQPELLSLFHLPVYGMAALVEGEWRLGILDLEQEDKLRKGHPYIKREYAEFAENVTSLSILAITEKAPHETSFHSGVRFLPAWWSKSEADNYRKRSMYFIPRMFTKERQVSLSELNALLKNDCHNYLCVQEDHGTWECLIVNEVLDLQRNTLLLA